VRKVKGDFNLKISKLWKKTKLLVFGLFGFLAVARSYFGSQRITLDALLYGNYSDIADFYGLNPLGSDNTVLCGYSNQCTADLGYGSFDETRFLTEINIDTDGDFGKRIGYSRLIRDGRMYFFWTGSSVKNGLG